MKQGMLILTALLALASQALGFGGSVDSALPQSFGIGAIDKNDNWAGDSTGPHRWKENQGTTCWDYSYQYLVSGWEGWSSPSGQWAVNEMTLWQGRGQTQLFSYYYNGPWYPSGYNSTTNMTTWFNMLALLFQKIEASGASGKKVIVHFEPDMLGFFVRDNGVNVYNQTGRIQVGSCTTPTGWTGTGTRAWNTTNYPNTLQGWAKAIKDMRDLISPNKVLIAHHYTHWATASGSVGDVFSQPANASDVDGAVAGMTTFLNNLGGGSTAYMDLFVADPADRDADWWKRYKGDSTRWNAESYTVSWGTRSWATIAYVIDKVSTNLGKRCIMWQVPNGNRFYKTMNNSAGHWRDNYSQGVLPSTSINGATGTPGDAISQSSTTAGPGFWANKGLIAVLFGEGYYGEPEPSSGVHLTHLRDYGPADGTTNPTADSWTGGQYTLGSGTSTSTDNDGGYLRAAVAAYCSKKFLLPGVGTPTYTPTVCAACTNTYTMTPTRTPTPKVDCPRLLNSCDSLTAYGTWAGANATRSINTSANGSITEGTGSLQVQVTTTNSWNAAVANLTFPSGQVLGQYKRITFDVYVPSTSLPWNAATTYKELAIRAEAPAASKYQVMFTAENAKTLSSGMNSLEFNLNLTTTANISATDSVTMLYFILSIGTPATGLFYIDNIVLHSDAVCPTNTATPTISPTFTPTVDCPRTLNSGDSLTVNGVWEGNLATRAVNTTTSLGVTEGTGNIFVNITATVSASGFNDKVANLGGFVPTDWSYYNTLSVDVYVDPTYTPWTGAATTHNLVLYGESQLAGKYEQTIATAEAPLVTGLNRITFTLSRPGGASIGPADPMSKIFFVLNTYPAAAQAAGRIYIDNVVLHTGGPCPTNTRTPTISPTFTPTVDCPRTLNTADSLTVNGVWEGNLATRAVNTTTSLGVTEGTGNIYVNITSTVSASGFNDKVANLGGFVPSDWTYYTTLSADIYVDPTYTPWTALATTHNVVLYGESQLAGKYEQTISAAEVPLNTGLNRVTFTLSRPGGASIGPADPMSKIFFVLNTYPASAQQVGRIYIDNIVLHTGGACPPTYTATRTSTNSPVYTNTLTATPSRTATPTASQTMSSTSTPVASFTQTATPTGTATQSRTATPSGTPSSTSLPTGTSTATRTTTMSSTQTVTGVPTSSYTSTSTASPTRSSTATSTQSSTSLPTGTQTSTATPSSTRTGTGTASSTATATHSRTSTPTSTISVTFSPVPTNSTETMTSTVSPTRSATPSSTATPSRTATSSSTSLPTGTVTITGSATLTPYVLFSATSTVTNAPGLTSTHTATPSSTRTMTGTPTATGSSSVTLLPTGTATATQSRTPTISVTFTEVPTGSSSTVTPSVSPTWSATPSRTSSATASSTITAGNTYTSTVTRSATPTVSRTGTASSSVTPGNTHTSTSTRSATATATHSRTATPSVTLGNTVTSTITPSATASSSQTRTVTATGSRTSTGTAVNTSTVTPSSTATPSSTRTITGTALPTGTATQTSIPTTPTAEPTTIYGEFGVEKVLPVPNPNPKCLAVKLQGPADAIKVRAYGKAMVQAAAFKASIANPRAGWVQVEIPKQFKEDLPTGTWFLVVSSEKGGREAGKKGSCKLQVLK